MASPDLRKEEDNYLDKILEKHFTNCFRFGYCNIEGVTMPIRFQEMHQEILELPVYEEDVWICSFPKTGTTWTQEMVWMIMNDINFEEAKNVSLGYRSPFLELSAIFDYREIMKNNPHFNPPPFQADSLKYVKSLKHPACIKTHLPYHLLPEGLQNGCKKPKIIYVGRNPKDTCVSYYHHSKFIEGYTGNFEDFCNLFLADKVTFAPFWNHILSFWKKRHDPTILFIKYEEMKKDLPSVIRKVSQFLEKPLNESQIESMTKHLSFENMKNNPSVNYEALTDFHKEFKIIEKEREGAFMRKGAVGSYKESMSPEIIQKFDKWTEENLKNTDFRF